MMLIVGVVFALLAISKSLTMSNQYTDEQVFFEYSAYDDGSGFSFRRCYWQQYYCDSEYQDCDSGSDYSTSKSKNQTKVGAYRTIQIYSFNQCMNKFCDPDKSYQYSYWSLKDCIDNAKWTLLKKVLKIIGIAAGSYCGSLILCYYIMKWTQCCIYKNNFQLANHPFFMNQLSSRQILGNWDKDLIRNQMLDEICSICLDRGPSLQLECRHIYHRACIIACISRKYECILCRSNHIDFIKIYCETCYRNYYHASLTLKKAQIASVKQICDLCCM